jgi:uncharacterized membrane protein YuzA (DUF378 family)
MKTAFRISLFLTIIGGINWGLIGFIGYDAIAAMFGGYNIMSQIVFSAVGIAAVVLTLLSRDIVLLSLMGDEEVKLHRTRRSKKART